MNTVMPLNARLREVKLRYDMERARLTKDFNNRQHEISKQLDLIRNERSYWLTMLKMNQDIETAKVKVDELTLRIAALHREKNDLDYDRKMRLLDHQHRHHDEIDRLEQEAQHAAQEGGEA